jgi:TldD protein
MLDPSDAIPVALDCLARSKVSHGDVRVVRVLEETINTRNGAVETMTRSESFGFGIRVLRNGGWGYAASADLVPREIVRICSLACRIAAACTGLRERAVVLAPQPAVTGSYVTPVERDPFTVPFEERLDLLVSLNETGQKVKGVTVATAHLGFRREEKHFASTEGSRIQQVITHSGGGISATAMGGHREMGRRSYPSSQEGQYEARGYELIERLNLTEHTQRIGEEAVALLAAPPAPSEQTTLVLDGPQVALQIHESIGHPLELDRVFGAEANFSGTSFATPDQLGKLRYASPMITVQSDATFPGGLGTFGFDDEGVPAQRVDLIREGVLVGYISSRETAALIGGRSSGAMLADGWQNLPLVRMTNTNLLPGSLRTEEIIAGTDKGIFLSGTTSWSIDDRREGFEFGCEVGWLIRNGRLAEMVKSPAYSGSTVEFWNSCDAVASGKEWRIWGTPNCGKGQPGQTMRVGQGASPCRFRNVSIHPAQRT